MHFDENNGYGIALLTSALNDANIFHRTQVDKNGVPYLRHPMRVAGHFMAQDRVEETIVALLHDVIEDTDCSMGILSDSYPEAIVDAVDAITRRYNETYRQYIKRCCENDIARAVKRQDILDNLRPERRLSNSMFERYYWALGYIDSVYRMDTEDEWEQLK